MSREANERERMREIKFNENNHDINSHVGGMCTYLIWNPIQIDKRFIFFVTRFQNWISNQQFLYAIIGSQDISKVIK